MSSKAIIEPTVDDIMRYWSKCGSITKTAEHFGKSYKTIEPMVGRYNHAYERSFNFPEILHAKRFGA